MERWLSYKGTCHVILLAKLHDMYLYKTVTFPHQPLKSVSEVALLHRFHCMVKPVNGIVPETARPTELKMHAHDEYMGQNLSTL